MPLTQRKLGSQGLVVPCLGLGCMGMTAFYGDFNRYDAEEANQKTIDLALKSGLNFFDTAWIYQSFGAGGGDNITNEEVLGRAIKRHGRDKFIIATKFGIGMGPNGMVFSGKPDFIRSQLNDSLTRLGISCIDLYYMHRMDPSTPIEEMMACLKELIAEGKIKYIGLSECTPQELRRAHAVHPISAIQMEWSLNTRDLESTIIPVARELGVGIVAYSPLGRGLLAGTMHDKLDPNDWRRKQPRFKEENLLKNESAAFYAYAQKKGVTPAQLALAWVLARGEDVVPIPGTKSESRLLENIGSTDLKLTAAEWLEVEACVPAIIGDRYEGMGGTFNQRL